MITFEEYITEASKPALKDKILKMLKENRKKEIVQYCKNNNIYQEDLQNALIDIASEYVDYTKIKKVENELYSGINVEKEHKPTYEFVKKTVKDTGSLPPEKEFYESIAKDHLKEFKFYYTYLKNMEDRAEHKIDILV